MEPKRIGHVELDRFNWGEPMEIPFPAESYLTLSDNLGPIRTLKAPSDHYWPHCVWSQSQVQRWLKTNAAWLQYQGDEVWITPGRNLITRLRNFRDEPALLINPNGRSGGLDHAETMYALYDHDLPWQYVATVGRRNSRPLYQILECAPPRPCNEADDFVTGLAKHIRERRLNTPSDSPQSTRSTSTMDTGTMATADSWSEIVDTIKSVAKRISDLKRDTSFDTGSTGTMDSRALETIDSTTSTSVVKAWLAWEERHGYKWSLAPDDSTTSGGSLQGVDTMINTVNTIDNSDLEQGW